MMRILLVEPDKILGEVIAAALKKAGHSVVVKRSAQTALNAVDDHIPDLIVLEIQLGLHNGIEFLYEIRSYSEWQNIPVIVHTRNSKALDEQFATAFAELKALAVLYKPRTTTNQLVHAVQQLVTA